MLAQVLSAAPLLLRQDTAVPAAATADADAAGCLVIVATELAPIVMVMGQGRESPSEGRGAEIPVHLMRLNCDVVLTLSDVMTPFCPSFQNMTRNVIFEFLNHDC